MLNHSFTVTTTKNETEKKTRPYYFYSISYRYQLKSIIETHQAANVIDTSLWIKQMNLLFIICIHSDMVLIWFFGHHGIVLIGVFSLFFLLSSVRIGTRSYCEREFRDCRLQTCYVQSPAYPGLYPRALNCRYRLHTRQPFIKLYLQNEHFSVDGQRWAFVYGIL